jgi:hypothetical protein
MAIRRAWQICSHQGWSTSLTDINGVLLTSIRRWGGALNSWPCGLVALELPHSCRCSRWSLERFGPDRQISGESTVVDDVRAHGVKLGAAEKLDAAERREADVAELRCCCGRSSGCGVRLNIRAASRAAPVLAFNCGQRSCDLRTSKQTLATAAVICGPEVSKAQCFRGLAAKTWRANAHGERRDRPFWGPGRR